jgi:isopenicillin N synthase-like dioxygenase
MKLLIIFVVIIYVNAFVNDPKQDQCDKLCSINLNEIDMSKFIIGTIEDKQEIALLFDKTFHEYGVIRLINNNITSELLAKAERFFSLDFETKMKYYVDGSYYYTNDNAKFSLRLTQYLPTKNEEDLAFGEHQDYLGFTLLQNDDVPGKNLRFYKVKFQLVYYFYMKTN